MVNAPINEFYDVTPVDRIVTRFNASVDCFSESIINALLRIFSNISLFFIKISIFATVSNWMAAICIVAAMMLINTKYEWKKV